MKRTKRLLAMLLTLILCLGEISCTGIKVHADGGLEKCLIKPGDTYKISNNIEYGTVYLDIEVADGMGYAYKTSVEEEYTIHCSYYGGKSICKLSSFELVHNNNDGKDYWVVVNSEYAEEIIQDTEKDFFSFTDDYDSDSYLVFKIPEGRTK